MRPLPQRSPIRVKKFSRSLLIVDDVAELLQVHRIEIVRADIENPVIDHPEFCVICKGLAARPGRVGSETQRCQVYVAAQQCVDRIRPPSHLVACLGIALVDALLHQVAQMAREGGQTDAVEVGAAAVAQRARRLEVRDEKDDGAAAGHVVDKVERIDDIRAAMDAADMDRAAMIGMSEGGPVAALYAATYPERCSALVLYGTFAKFSSWIPTEQAFADFLEYIDKAWGTGGSVRFFAPSRANDPAYRRWWGRFERLGASPAAATALMRMNSKIDIRSILPTIRVPTLVIHRT